MAFVIEDAPAPATPAGGRFVIADEPAADRGDPRAEALKNVSMGALKGASDIGATILQGLAKIGTQGKTQSEDIRPKLGEFFQEHADTSSPEFKGGELGADVAGTAGVGGTLAKGVTAAAKLAPVLAKYAPRLAAALESGGFRTGAAPVTAGEKVADVATRAGAGAAVGGASAGLVNPEDAGTGAVLGGTLPGAAQAAGAAGKALAVKVAPEVQALYQKAKDLGIDIPADRIVNSKPLNALASSLNYVPLSGRAGTEEKMVSQLNRAVSRTFGQDSDNVTAALRRAQTALGDKFEMTLKGNRVAVDEQFLNDLAQHVETANKELGADGARVIKNQVDEILSKVGSGSKGGYGGPHRPVTLEGGAAQLHDLTPAFGKDIYSKNAAHYFGTGDSKLDHQTLGILNSVKNKPDAEVSIYRSVPKDASETINPGDWVTVNKNYAAQHGESALEGNYKIVEKKVRASDLTTNADSFHEQGYHPTRNDTIDGQAAYNIKKSLDRIGQRNTPEAYYARDLKKLLMGALNRSLGPEEAEKFAQVRKQYGNMLDIESIAQNGAEGGVSVARLANMKGINNPQLQDLADIAAQFVKPREGMHGAAQRVGAGVLAAGAAHTFPAAAPAIAAGMAAGRGTNMALNSATLKDLVLGQSQLPENARRLGGNPALRSLLYLNANRANP